MTQYHPQSQIVLKGEAILWLQAIYVASLQPGQSAEYHAGFTQAIIAMGVALGVQPDAIGIRVESQHGQLEGGTR